jgi:hypothetical protein
MALMRHAPSVFAALAVLAACGGPNDARSPAVDYPEPPPTTADGEVVGADRMAPGDKLDTGPKAGPGGVTTARPPGSERPPTPYAPDDPRCKEPVAPVNRARCPSVR